MPTPDFVLDLRRSIGHDLLWLNGVTGFVEDDQGRILMGRRSDTGQWALVYGINEPGEDPADTVAREVREETGVDVVVTDLVAVTSSREVITYANGGPDHVHGPSLHLQARPGREQDTLRGRRGEPLGGLVQPGPSPQPTGQEHRGPYGQGPHLP